MRMQSIVENKENATKTDGGQRRPETGRVVSTASSETRV
jgi:hypothetical protein